MGNVLIEEQILYDIAVQLRTYAGGANTKYKPADMPCEIMNVYDEGYIDGDTDGYDTYFPEGYDIGYEEGYAQGCIDGKELAGGGETIIMLPQGMKTIETSAYENCGLVGKLIIPASVEEVNGLAFVGNPDLTEVVFKGMPLYVDCDAFYDCSGVKTIKVPWFEGDVMDAPWGAWGAEIVYEYTED